MAKEQSRGGDYRGDGGDTSPNIFVGGGRKRKCPAPLIAHLVILLTFVWCLQAKFSWKFRPKMRQNAFGGRAPPGPAGGAWALPQTP